jgi:endoglucanase
VRFGRFIISLVVLACLAGAAWGQSASWPLWDAYSAAFIDSQGRVIDHQRGSLTTSEGQSYAMFFALVANDRARFDQLLDWTRNNLAEGDLTAHLPGWEWGKAPDGQWKLLDSHSAADSDLWICFDLAEAGRLWHQPRYTALAHIMAERISSSEVANLPGFGPMVLPGDAGFHPSHDLWVLNPSYVPLPVIQRLAVLNPSGPWAAIAHRLPAFLRRSSPNGFAMNWVSYSPTGGFLPAGQPGPKGQPITEPEGSYDAIRVYLWAGLSSPASPESRAALAAVGGMSSWLDSHLFPPEVVSAAGIPGKNDGPVGFSAAVIPYLGAFGKKFDPQEDRLQAQLDPATKLYGHPPAYYDQNLAMFAEGWQSHRFRFESNGELKVSWKH